MKKIIMLFFLCVFYVTGVFAQSQNYDFVINHRNDIPYSLSDIQRAIQSLPSEEPTTTTGRLTKGFLLFQYAVQTLSPEDTMQAFEYLQKIYDEDPRLRNPILFGYVGSIEAAIGGAVQNPIKKVQYLNSGIEKLDTAISDVKKENSKDAYAIGFLYFLRGRVLSSVPSFIELSDEAPGNFKTALSYFKKAKLTKSNGSLIAELYFGYANYHKVRGKIRLAKKNMQIAVKLASSDEAKNFYTEELKKLE